MLDCSVATGSNVGRAGSRTSTERKLAGQTLGCGAFNARSRLGRLMGKLMPYRREMAELVFEVVQEADGAASWARISRMFCVGGGNTPGCIKSAATLLWRRLSRNAHIFSELSPSTRA
jgi:hypothetical protein